MVTEAGKELLRNTINTAKFHNKLLEENEMWKQWELERGLTMMVSDDDVLKKIRKNHLCSKHQKREISRDKRPIESYNTASVPGTSKDASDRWDHSGFQELYPDAIETEKHSSSSDSKEYVIKKWDHSGFRELYPDAVVETGKCSSSYDSRDRLKKKHKKKAKRHRSDKSSSDDEIYEDFKRYKRSQSKKTNVELMKNASSGFDNHVKEWRKHKDKSF